MYGAIGNCLRQPVYFLAQGTNAVDYQRFLRKIVKKINHTVVKPTLLYDGASAHTATASRIMMATYFTPL